MKKILGSLVILALSAGLAQAQTFVVTPYLSGDGLDQSDTVIRETRSGANVTGAALDLCFGPTAQDGWDRVQVQLNAAGGTLTGTAVSQKRKANVAVNLKRKRDGNTIVYDGTITIGGKQYKVDGQAEERTEAVFRKEKEESVNPIIENPADFTRVSWNQLGLQIKAESLPEFVKALRGLPVSLDLMIESGQDCEIMRTGNRIVQLTVLPENAADVLGKIKNLPGVVRAGYGGYGSAGGVRVAIADWSAGGKLDKSKLAPAVADAVAKALNAQVISTKWSDDDGSLSVKVKRRSADFGSLNLAEEVETTLHVYAEKPAGASHFIIATISSTAKLLDEGSPGLRIRQAANEGGEGTFLDIEPIEKGIAQSFKGQLWDVNAERWR